MRFAPIFQRAAVAGFVACAVAASAAEPFDFQRDCAQWIEKHGYSSDYIKLKVGKRQRGVPETWTGNVEPKDVQVGDVVISYIREKGRNSRAAYVEDVRRNFSGEAAAVFVSEWNMGPYIDERCFVTTRFGVISQNVIGIDAVVRVWRPSLPL